MSDETQPPPEQPAPTAPVEIPNPSDQKLVSDFLESLEHFRPLGNDVLDSHATKLVQDLETELAHKSNHVAQVEETNAMAAKLNPASE